MADGLLLHMHQHYQVGWRGGLEWWELDVLGNLLCWVLSCFSAF